jgi:putative membrane protein
MTADLIYAFIHFAGAFVLFGALFAQAALLMTGVGPGKVSYARLARMDIVYACGALAVLIGGVLRVFYGARGAAFYIENPAFHAKVTLFILIALISIAPTVTFIKWRRAAKVDPAFLPAPKALKRVKMILHVQLTLLALLILSASVMARVYAL